MAPIAIESSIVDVVQPKKDSLEIPATARERLVRAGIDLWNGYPYRPARPLYLQDAFNIRNEPWEHVDAGLRVRKMDQSKHCLLSAATKVTNLTSHIGTEIEGLQLKDLDDQQRDALALLLAERSVVFFRDQDAFCAYIQPPETVSDDHRPMLILQSAIQAHSSRRSLVNIIERSKCKTFYKSAHAYLDRDDPHAGPKNIERIHPIVRVHPATGWKALWVNRAFTKRIVGLDQAESDLILNYLFDVSEKNVDIQVRFRWTPRTSALWDNRITIHNASWDYENGEPRHGTRVTSLAEVPYFDPNAPSRRQALGLEDPE